LLELVKKIKQSNYNTKYNLNSRYIHTNNYSHNFAVMSGTKGLRGGCYAWKNLGTYSATLMQSTTTSVTDAQTDEQTDKWVGTSVFWLVLRDLTCRCQWYIFTAGG